MADAWLTQVEHDLRTPLHLLMKHGFLNCEMLQEAMGKASP